MPDADRELARDRALLAEAMREAGDIALTMFRRGVRHWIKGAASPVSEADIAVNDALEARLAGATPSYGWLSEESADNPVRLTRRRAWIVDPIDGTRAFIAGGDDWAVSVALVEDGRPLLAAVMAPVTGELFEAVAGGGALLGGASIHATAGDALEGAVVAGSKTVLDRLGVARHGMTAGPKIGSLALRLARVAEGRLDIAVARGDSHDWDLAAADLLVHEAGGRLTTLDGADLVYNRPQVVHEVLVAAGRARHGRLIEVFRSRAEI